MTSLTLSILALSLLTGADARALTKQSITWNDCPDLNKNISIATAAAGPFESFQCGTLSVPLDYTDDSSPQLPLDLFRVKATKEPVLGTVLFNPGGPGGAAADNLPPCASDLRSNIGEQYHIVSWDPRGTGYTLPFNLSITDDSTPPAPPTKRDLDTLDSVNVTKYFLASGWEIAGLTAEAAALNNNETGSLIGTAFTARDMLAIVDALDEDGLLRYYGVSYGTVLGHYFATMFPERVERMVLDANLDPAAYTNGTWGDSILHWDEVFNLFLEACFENKDECSLATYTNANSTQGMLDVINQPLGQLVTAVESNYSDAEAQAAVVGLKSIIHGHMYQPSTWPALAEEIVAELNATEPDDDATEPWKYGDAVSAIYGIRASDTIWKPSSAEEYLPAAEYQATVSSFSDVWYFAAWVAAQWKMPAKERFSGKFEAKTKHPILYINGDYDPVTPVEDAHSASKGFEGSVVLEHTGIGHTVLADPSVCVQKHVQAYFKDGTLPEGGTRCESDLKPWPLAKAREGKPFGALNTTFMEV